MEYDDAVKVQHLIEATENLIDAIERNYNINHNAFGKNRDVINWVSATKEAIKEYGSDEPFSSAATVDDGIINSYLNQKHPGFTVDDINKFLIRRPCYPMGSNRYYDTLDLRPIK